MMQKKYYDANTDKFRQEERVRAKHILMKVEKGASEDKKAQARKKTAGYSKENIGGRRVQRFGKRALRGTQQGKRW
jgi:hypothetical protein